MELLTIPLSIFDNLDAATFFDWFINNASYLFVFVFMIVESSFIPFPSEVVVPPAVYIAFEKGDMNVVVIVLLATLGALIGATVNYLLSLWLGRPIVYRFANSKFGHMCLIDEPKVVKAEKYFDEHGASATFFGRLIPAVRQLVSIPAGLSRMNFWKFALFTSMGALVWNIVLALLGYILHLSVPKDVLFEYIEKYNSYLTISGVALLVILIAFFVVKSKRKK